MGLESPNNLTKVIRVRQEKELKKHEADKDRDQSQNQSCAVRQKEIRKMKCWPQKSGKLENLDSTWQQKKAFG